VDRLEKLGLAHRVHAQDDRRKILVQTTPKGGGLVSEVREDMIANLLRLMGQLNAEEQKSWVGIYEKIHAYCQNT
jgi:DNA-binding MarR family transcriptional regulator